MDQNLVLLAQPLYCLPGNQVIDLAHGYQLVLAKELLQRHQPLVIQPMAMCQKSEDIPKGITNKKLSALKIPPWLRAAWPIIKIHRHWHVPTFGQSIAQSSFVIKPGKNHHVFD